MFNELCGRHPQQWHPTVGYWTTILCLNNSFSSLVIFMPHPHCKHLNWIQLSHSIGNLAWWQNMASWESISPITKTSHLNHFHRLWEVSTFLGFFSSSQRSPKSSHLFWNSLFQAICTHTWNPAAPILTHPKFYL